MLWLLHVTLQNTKYFSTVFVINKQEQKCKVYSLFFKLKKCPISFYMHALLSVQKHPTFCGHVHQGKRRSNPCPQKLGKGGAFSPFPTQARFLYHNLSLLKTCVSDLMQSVLYVCNHLLFSKMSSKTTGGGISRCSDMS